MGSMMRSGFGFLFLMFLVTACAPAVPPPSPAATPTGAATPYPTATRPVVSPAPPGPVAPSIVTDQRMIFASWSPDSRYVAYWVAEKVNGPDDIRIAGKLNFVGVDGQKCTDDNLVIHRTWPEFSKLVVQRDQSLIVRTDRGLYQGTPCGSFTPIEGDFFPDLTVQRSPDGRSSAHISQTGSDQLSSVTVSFTSTATGSNLETVSWQESIYNQRTGPRWLNNDIFILGQTFDRGLIDYSVSQDRVGEVGLDFFHDRSICNPDACWIHTYADSRSGIFHILLLSTTHPRTLLYHSENGQVEDVLFKMAWPTHSRSPDLTGFSDDGKWLLGLNGPGDPYASQSGADYWTRPVDPSGSPLVLFNRDAPRAWGDLALESGWAALWDLSGIYLYSFPEGRLLEQAYIQGGTPQDEVWSPDARWLAVMGYDADGRQLLALWRPSL